MSGRPDKFRAINHARLQTGENFRRRRGPASRRAAINFSTQSERADFQSAQSDNPLISRQTSRPQTPVLPPINGFTPKRA
jgi:hypothetical protein